MASPDSLRPRRRPTVSVDVGGVLVGSAHPVVVQSMTNTDTADPDATAIQVGDVFWQLGPLATLYLAGILSANLALVNILPFPPLDGGRMLMIVLKAIFGSRISVRAERLTYVVGFAFLFAFLIWVSGFDIVRILSGGT